MKVRLDNASMDPESCVYMLNMIFRQHGIDETATPSNTKTELKELTKDHMIFKITHTPPLGVTRSYDIPLPRFIEFEPVNGIVNPAWIIIKEESEDEDL